MQPAGRHGLLRSRLRDGFAGAHSWEGDGMDEPTDPPARQLALSALTTEQFNLQTARMGTIAEANGRSTL